MHFSKVYKILLLLVLNHQVNVFSHIFLFGLIRMFSALLLMYPILSVEWIGLSQIFSQLPGTSHPFSSQFSISDYDPVDFILPGLTVSTCYFEVFYVHTVFFILHVFSTEILPACSFHSVIQL